MHFKRPLILLALVALPASLRADDVVVEVYFLQK
jgi:hypothetical protein